MTFILILVFTFTSICSNYVSASDWLLKTEAGKSHDF